MKTSLNAAIVLSFAMAAGSAAAQNVRGIDPAKAKVIEHWTSERRTQAIPRDLRIDPRGLGYLRRPDGSLVPHGHETASNQPASPSERAAPGSGDSTPPSIALLDPVAGQTIGASHTFSATVTDASGLRSVTFKLQKQGSIVQSFSAAPVGNDKWAVSLQGFTNGAWSWWVEAKDGAPRGGNPMTSPPVVFTVDTGTGGGGGGGSTDTVTNAHWTLGGAVKRATGRLYFEMPGNAKRKTWWGYVCSGTVATDDTAGRSVIVTAAHCIYDDVNKAFARNVMFIPDQDGTSGTGTDRNCSNDPIGCWVPTVGVVDVNWTTRTFPANVAWDYGFYVVPDDGAHQGNGSTSVLDLAAGSLWINFSGVSINDLTHALGYSQSEDPKLMYCAEDMTTEGADNWWLPSCLLSGGSSGGPWIQPLTSAAGPIISVNSWGYTTGPGMAGPKLVTSAGCIFTKATTLGLPPTPVAEGTGVSVSCP